MPGKHIHRTAVFTIHNPTKHIRAVLDEALQNYTRAYTSILDFFSSYTAEELHAMAVFAVRESNGEELTNARTLETALFRTNKIPDLDQLLEPLEARLRASMKSDIASTLLSFAELSLTEKQKPSYPNRVEEDNRDAKREAALEGLRTISDDLEEENTLRDQLLRTRQRGLVPLSFGNSMPDQGFRIFYNPETRTFYVRLYVIGELSNHGRRIDIDGQYIDIREPENIYMRNKGFQEHKTGLKRYSTSTHTILGDYHLGMGRYQEVRSFGNGTRSILVPLEMGRWHENMLRFTKHAFLPQRSGDTSVKPAWPVSAKLMKYGDKYQLHVAFQFPRPERIKPATYLGIDRSISYLASGAVVSLDGKEVIETFNVSTDELNGLIGAIEKNIAIKQKKGKTTKGDRRRARIADRHVHQVANSIVEMARTHQSQVIVEDLSYIAPKKRVGGKGKAFNRILQRRQYQKLQDLLATKLDIAGLTPLRKVSSAYTASTCSQCGCVSKENFDKEDKNLFHCIECGYTTDVGQQSGINIVRKLPFLQLRSKQKQKEIPEAERTTWEEFARGFKA
ncbi:MAG TPA: IS200/IS605 family accessory protein TnpB-related protein [Ktedonobacteraceae bacterium]|jgi:IS605 OrfB family transposase|nr:IS200/IS605 family accessory protein TnpB-related protein [Ktedonobacteraceae bacterium]